MIPDQLAARQRFLPSFCRRLLPLICFCLVLSERERLARNSTQIHGRKVGKVIILNLWIHPDIPTFVTSIKPTMSEGQDSQEKRDPATVAAAAATEDDEEDKVGKCIFFQKFLPPQKSDKYDVRSISSLFIAFFGKFALNLRWKSRSRAAEYRKWRHNW